MIRPYLAEQHGLDDLRLDGLACRRERRRDLHEDSGGRVVASDVHGQCLKLQIDLSWNVAQSCHPCLISTKFSHSTAVYSGRYPLWVSARIYGRTISIYNP